MYRLLLLFILTTSVIYASPENTLQWSSFIGASSTDAIECVTTDELGNIYVYGYTKSNNFKTTPNAFQSNYYGASELFLMKFSNDNKLLWSTLIGGNDDEYPKNIKCNKDYIWIAADSRSYNFPTTNDAYQKKNKGYYDGVIMKFSSEGKMLYSSYIGSNSYDVVDDIVIDNDENIWFTGRVYGDDFKTTSNADQRNNSGGVDSYIAKFDKNGQAIYTSYLGGSNSDFAMDIALNKKSNLIAITGYTESNDFPIKGKAISPNKNEMSSYDSFISYFNTDGKLVWSSYFGGDGNDYAEHITENSDDGFYLRMFTNSPEVSTPFNTFQKINPGDMSSYIASVNSKGELEWGTFYGGSTTDGYSNINNKGGELITNSKGDLLLSGFTRSNNLPITKNAYQSNLNGESDAYLVRISKIGSLLYSSYLGGNQSEEGRSIMIHNNKIYVAGWTESSDFPTTADAFNKVKSGDRDGFLSIFDNDDVSCNEVYNSNSGFNNSVIKSNRKIDKSSFVRLTGTGEFDLGYMFHRNPINLTSGFETEFSFLISEGRAENSTAPKDNQTMTDSSLPGADGIVLIIAGAIPTTNGERGGGIGYAGFSNAVALEIDLFENSNYNDPNGNHFAIQIPGENGQLSARHNPETTLLMNDSIVEITSDSSQTYYCRVEYRNKTLTVYLDNTNNFKNPIAELNDFDISKYLKMDMQSNGFLGLTSATGKAVEIHDITHWDICSYQKALLSSIEDRNDSYGFYVYPNPTDDELHLQLPQGLTNAVQLTLTDLLGRTVLSQSISAGSGNAVLNLNGLSKGLYNISISDDNETMYNSKVIKK